MVDHKTLLHNELRSALTRHGPCFTSARNAASNPHPGVSTVSALRVRRFAVLSLLGTLVWAAPATAQGRSEERRVGKECRSRWGPSSCKQKDKVRGDINRGSSEWVATW